MTIEKMYILPAGSVWLDQKALNGNLSKGKLTKVPVWVYLLETIEGLVLIDTGQPDVYLDKYYYDGTNKEGLCYPELNKEEQILSLLNRLGYQADDIKLIINTHLHSDHSGGNKHFPNTPIIVQKNELEIAKNNESYAPLDCVLPNLNYKTIDGDREIIPGINTIYTPGHSPGHQSLIVKTKFSGEILITADATYTQKNFTDFVPSISIDKQQSLQSVKRLNDLVDKRDINLIIYGHDANQIEDLPLYPKFL